MYFDKNGKPITLERWAKLLEDPTYKIIKQEVLPNGMFVSTVWLGLNHSFFENISPLMFETMVFQKKGEWDEKDMQRYATLAKAKKGHKELVKKWSK